MKDTIQAQAGREGPSPDPSSVTPETRLLPAFWQTLLARRGFVAYLPIALALLLLFCGVSEMNTDALHYQCYSMAFWRGTQSLWTLPPWQCAYLSQLGIHHNSAGPFHILPLEYPPLTLSLFSVAYLVPPLYYQPAFALMMAAVAFAIYWLLLRYGPRGAGMACAFYLVIGAWATAEGRFDLVPAGLTLLCLIAAERKRWTLAYVALAFGFLFKIYPILLLPALFIAEQIAHGLFFQPSEPLKLQTLPGALWRTLSGMGRWRWKNTLLFLALIAGVTALFALINFQAAVLSQLSYFTDRPVQIEATGSTILWLATLIGHPAVIVHSFGSFNIVSNLGHRVALLSEAFFVLGYALALLWQWRGKLDLVQAFIALILVFIVTGKVFSPQYLIWLIPLLAYNGSFNKRWLVLWGGVSLVTTIIYPYLYNWMDPMGPGVPWNPYISTFVALVPVRNLLLLLVTLAFLFNWGNFNRRQLPARSTPGGDSTHNTLPT